MHSLATSDTLLVSSIAAAAWPGCMSAILNSRGLGIGSALVISDIYGIYPLQK